MEGDALMAWSKPPGQDILMSGSITTAVAGTGVTCLALFKW